MLLYIYIIPFCIQNFNDFFSFYFEFCYLCHFFSFISIILTTFCRKNEHKDVPARAENAQTGEYRNCLTRYFPYNMTGKHKSCDRRDKRYRRRSAYPRFDRSFIAVKRIDIFYSALFQLSSHNSRKRADRCF